MISNNLLGKTNEPSKGPSSSGRSNAGTSMSFELEVAANSNFIRTRDMIFEGDEPEERGDHIVESDFVCPELAVVWLPTKVDSLSTEKKSDMFFQEVEVGANETATALDRMEPLPNHSPCIQEAASAICSDVIVMPSMECCKRLDFTDISDDTQVEAKTTSEALCDVNQSEGAKPYYVVNVPLSSNVNEGEESSSVMEEVELQATPGCMPVNELHFAVPVFQPSEIAPTTSSQSLQQSHAKYISVPAPIRFPIISTGQPAHEILPSYVNNRFGLANPLNFYQNIDASSTVISYQTGSQCHPETYGNQVCASNTQSSVIQTAPLTTPLSTGIVFSQQVGNLSETVDTFSANPCISQPQNQYRSCLPLQQQYLNTVAITKMKDGSTANMRAPPISTQKSLTKSTIGYVASCQPLTRAIQSLEDLTVLSVPPRLGVSLSKQACYTKKRSQTIDVLVRNSVRNFEVSSCFSSKVPMHTVGSPARFFGDRVRLSNHDKPRIHSYLSIIKYPNMVDVNFRHRASTNAPSRPRHLCDQTREVIARVCAYFREFSKRFAALGNNIAGTPFENPDKMASHATGFALPTIRRCGERMETVPPCTASTPTDHTQEDLCSLSWIFAEDPWFANQKVRASKGRMTTRKRARKRASSSPSISEIEKDAGELNEEETVELELNLLDSDENEEGAIKLRRSERIRNQRRAKLLSRLKAVNANLKTKGSFTKIDKEKKDALSHECTDILANTGHICNKNVTMPDNTFWMHTGGRLTMTLPQNKKKGHRRAHSADSNKSTNDRCGFTKRSRSIAGETLFTPDLLR